MKTKNKCLKLNALNNSNIKNILELDAFYQRLTLLASKDSSILLEYNQILQSNQKADIGVCLCDQNYQGPKCESKDPNLSDGCQGLCNPLTSECRSSTLYLNNHFQIPKNLLNEYKLNYCECISSKFMGVNCEYKRAQCGIDKCPNELCYPLLMNSTSKCLNPNEQQLNYLTFDQTNMPLVSHNLLDLTDPAVLFGIQTFLVRDVFPRYNLDNYAQMPQGPVAIILNSVNMPDSLSYIKDKLNKLVDKDNNQASSNLDKLIATRLEKLIKNVLVKANKKTDQLNIESLIDSLNLAENDEFTIKDWNLNKDYSFSLQKSIEALVARTDMIKDMSQLNLALSLTPQMFNHSNTSFNLLKADILMGVYIDKDGEVSLRPTPGLFLSSLSNNEPMMPGGEFLFLPGLFNPAADQYCNTLFTPGIISLNKHSMAYLSTFRPLKMPFNLNGLLTDLKLSTSDTVLTMNDQKKKLASNSYLVLTPFDLNAETSMELLNSNNKFMSNLFSSGSFESVVKNQAPLTLADLAATQILSNVNMLSSDDNGHFNQKCLFNATSFDARGAQFYELAEPIQNVSILPFSIYDQRGEPIGQQIVQTALFKYCQAFQSIKFDF